MRAVLCLRLPAGTLDALQSELALIAPRANAQSGGPMPDSIKAKRWAAENELQSLAVVNRKVWGGNRTAAGARWTATARARANAAASSAAARVRAVEGWGLVAAARERAVEG